jgi:hypothetical protein
MARQDAAPNKTAFTLWRTINVGYFQRCTKNAQENSHMKLTQKYRFHAAAWICCLALGCAGPNRKATLKPAAISELLLQGEWIKDRDFFGDIDELQRVNADYFKQGIINKKIYNSYETVVKYKQLANTLMEGTWKISISDKKFTLSDQLTSKTLKAFTYSSIETPGGNFIVLKGENNYELFSLINPDYMLHYSVSSCGALYFPYKRLKAKKYAAP